MRNVACKIILSLLCVATVFMFTACAKKCEVEGCSEVVLDSEKGTLCSSHIKQYYEEAMMDYSTNLANDISDSIKSSSNKKIIAVSDIQPCA